MRRGEDLFQMTLPLHMFLSQVWISTTQNQDTSGWRNGCTPVKPILCLITLINTWVRYPCISFLVLEKSAFHRSRWFCSQRQRGSSGCPRAICSQGSLEAAGRTGRRRWLSFNNFGMYLLLKYFLPGEDIGEAAEREVREETGITCRFQSILCFRHQHQYNFGCSDLYFICLMKAESTQIKVCPNEIAVAQWMPVSSYSYDFYTH